MDEHTANAGRARHTTGVLTGCTTEAEQSEFAGIETLARGDLADGIGHCLDRYFQERLGDDLVGVAPTHFGLNSCAQALELALDSPRVDTAPTVPAKHGGQRLRP